MGIVPSSGKYGFVTHWRKRRQSFSPTQTHHWSCRTLAPPSPPSPLQPWNNESANWDSVFLPTDNPAKFCALFFISFERVGEQVDIGLCDHRSGGSPELLKKDKLVRPCKGRSTFMRSYSNCQGRGKISLLPGQDAHPGGFQLLPIKPSGCRVELCWEFHFNTRFN